MPESQSNVFLSLLNLSPISRVRRNHGLEHATLHVLAERYPRSSIAGHSNINGFWILGNIPSEDMQSAVQEALQRLQNGEQELAVHPNCGTNFVASGVLAGIAAAAAMFGAGRRFRDKVERLPMAAVFATLALMVGQPLGALMQERVTTSGQPGYLRVVEVIPSNRGRLKAHRIITEG